MNKGIRRRLSQTALSISLVLGVAMLVFLAFQGHEEAADSGKNEPAGSAQAPSSAELRSATKEGLPDVSGVVEDEAGNPLRGALVRAIHIISEVYLYDVATTETPEDGKYSLDGLLSDNRYRLVASAPGFVSSASETFIFEEEQAEINFVLANAPAAEDDAPNEVETIISGIEASIERIRSGRIVYTREIMASPSRYTDEDIEMAVVNALERLQERGDSEEEIKWQIRELRAAMERSRRQTGWRSFYEAEGEYIFEGDNSYHVFTTVGSEHVQEAYVSGGKTICVDTYEGSRISATIVNGKIEYMRPYRNPLHDLITLPSNYFSNFRDSWEISSVGGPEGEGAYTISSDKPYLSITVLPEKEYYITNMTSIMNIHGSIRGNRWKFSKMRWDSNAGIFYPMEFLLEEFGAKKDRKERFEFIEVEFGKDYDDDIFKPEFQEGTVITDRRFDPYKKFKYTYPETDKYLEGLDEKVKELKSDKQAH